MHLDYRAYPKLFVGFPRFVGISVPYDIIVDGHLAILRLFASSARVAPMPVGPVTCDFLNIVFLPVGRVLELCIPVAGMPYQTSTTEDILAGEEERHLR